MSYKITSINECVVCDKTNGVVYGHNLTRAAAHDLAKIMIDAGESKSVRVIRLVKEFVFYPEPLYTCRLVKGWHEIFHKRGIVSKEIKELAPVMGVSRKAVTVFLRSIRKNDVEALIETPKWTLSITRHLEYVIGSNDVDRDLLGATRWAIYDRNTGLCVDDLETLREAEEQARRVAYSNPDHCVAVGVVLEALEEKTKIEHDVLFVTIQKGGTHTVVVSDENEENLVKMVIGVADIPEEVVKALIKTAKSYQGERVAISFGGAVISIDVKKEIY